MIGPVSSGRNGFGNARRSMFPTWNKTAGISFDRMRNPTPLLSLSVRNVTKKENVDSGSESVWYAAVCEA
jgi:hypothetical protein